jgi:LPXTG-motif cell wall-anchored protein
MPRHRRIAALAVAALLAAPGAAGAQNAGDDQYQDPFAGEEQEQTQQPEQEPAAPAQEPAAPEAQAPPADAAPAAPAQPGQPAQLPYTGSDAAVLLAAGTVLLAGGVALRLRVRGHG